METAIEVAEKQTSIMERGTMSAASVLAHVAKVQGLMKDLLHEGEHYGKIPGTDKPTLLKAGAEKLSFTFRLLPKFRSTVREMPNGHREVEMVCELWHESGVFAGEGVGSCSTMESKYRYRNAAKRCPECGKETIIKGKEEYGGGWLCYAKKGGCGLKFTDNAPQIVNQITGKVENPDIADVFNTVLKMAKKRALVDATITACAASDIFTQDMEDIREEEMTNVTPPKAEATERPSSSPLVAQAAVQSIYRSCRDSKLFLDVELKAMVAEATKHKEDLPSLKHLAETWGKDLAERSAPINDAKVPFEDKAS